MRSDQSRRVRGAPTRSHWGREGFRVTGADEAELVGAGRGERAPEERLAHRNGYRPRVWATRAGEIKLAISAGEEAG